MQTPSVSDTVHYVSRGSADGKFPATCRAAIVTEVTDPAQPRLVGLSVLNPTGLFFDQDIPYDDGSGTPANPKCAGLHADGPHRYCECGWIGPHLAGGTWHWPERAEES
jgi:hypothetical protein